MIRSTQEIEKKKRNLLHTPVRSPHRQNKTFINFLFFVSCLFFLVGCSNQEEEQRFQPVNVEVDREGLVIVRESDLERMGMRFPEFGGVKVRKGDEEIPAWMVELEDVGTQKSLVFYATLPESRYSLDDTYQIIPSPERLTILQSAPPGFGTATIPVKTQIRLEVNALYEPLSTSDLPFFWQAITAEGEFTTTFDLPGYAQGTKARMMLAIRKRGAVEIHRIAIQINQMDLNTIEWEGDPEQEFEMEIPLSMLGEKENELVIKLLGEGSDRMVVDLDWIEIEYFQDNLTGRDFLHWTADNEYQSMSGWAGLTITVPIGGGEGWISQAGFGGVMSYLTIPGQEYITADEGGWIYPRLLRPIHTTDSLVRGFTGADYIILTPPAWKEDLEPLADFLRNQGLKPTIATLDAVYDQFNYGQIDPKAIQGYLRNALEKWELPPKYVLLVGDFSYLPANLPKNGDYLPGFFVKTQFGGETISDFPFSLDAENQPAIAIGRWPVENREELVRLIQARISVENSRGEPGRLLGMVDPSEVNFRQTFDIFRKLLESGSMEPGRILVSEVEPQKPPIEAQEILVYIGHGSLNQWGSPTIMDAEIFQKQWPKHPILILQFTCLTGYYIEPEKKSLSEEFLLEGVPAVISPTSLTLPGEQWALIEGWAKALGNPELHNVGEMLLSVWQTLPQSSTMDDVRRTFILLGDPSAHLFNPGE